MEQIQLQNIDKLLTLGLQERIFILEKLWKSVLDDLNTKNTLFSSEQIAEIDRRLADLESGKTNLYSWDEVKQSISATL